MRFCPVCNFLWLLAAALPLAAGPVCLTPAAVRCVAAEGGATEELTLTAAPYTRFTRGLLRFDLETLQPEKFRDVIKAELHFTVPAADNPSGLPLELAPLVTAWDDSATWTAPRARAAWPNDANRCAQIDCGADWQKAVSIPADRTGEIAIDVTRAVQAWAYRGQRNFGWLLRIGPSVYGLPDAQPFRVELRDPTLTVEFSGPAPTPAEKDAVTLRHFASAELPPVSTPYLFHIFSSRAPRYPDNLINSCDLATDGPENGFLAQQWFFGPNNPYLHSAEGFAEAYTAAAHSGVVGIHVDEWQGNRRLGLPIGGDEDPDRAIEDKIAWSIAGIRLAKQQNPDFQISVYWRGEDSIEPLTRDGLPDWLIVEAQSHLNRIFRPEWGTGNIAMLARLAYARKLGMIERTVAMIGFFENPENYHPEAILTREEVAEKIRAIRATFPECPGIAFYGSPQSGTPGTPAAELLHYAEAICFEQFIAPAPEIRINSPGFEAKITAAQQEIAVTATPKGDRTIQRYDWFVDNRLMAQTAEPRWLWDTRYWENGRHVLTVHAIDSGWNRAAARLPVTLQR